MPARIPVDFHVLKGNTAKLSQAEIEERKEREVKPETLKRVKIPECIKSKKAKEEYKKIAKELIKLDIFSLLDVDSLARFILSREQYLAIMDQVSNTSLMLEDNSVNSEYERLTTLANKYFTMCRQTAGDCGLTITSRCKIILPKKKEVDSNDDLFD